MPVVSSSFTIDPVPQKDGRRFVTETHQLNVGGPLTQTYLAAANADYAAIMAARVLLLNEGLAQNELDANIQQATFVLNHQTAAEAATRFRQRWQSSSKQDCARMAYWLIERINAGSFTDTQVRNAFGLTLTQYNTLKANKLVPYHDAWAALLAAVGE